MHLESKFLSAFFIETVYELIRYKKVKMLKFERKRKLLNVLYVKKNKERALILKSL